MNNLIASSQRCVIVGLGVTGLSVARHLVRTQQAFTVVDSRQDPPGLEAFQKAFPDIHIELGPLDFDRWGEVHQIILSPGVSRAEPAIVRAIEHGVDVVGDVALFAQEANAPIAAITGSNGKTTVTTLLGEMAKAAGLNVKVCGNIGTPVLDALDDQADVYIVELSSFQLESTPQLNAHVATILNLSADHMDRYATLGEYLRAKQAIFFGAKAVVVNKDDPLTQAPMANNVAYSSYGLSTPDLKQWGVITQGAETFIALGLEPLLALSDLKLRGSHNVQNVLAALAMGAQLNLPMESMLETARAFKGLDHRCQYVASIDGVEYFNDSKGTNVGATVAAIKGLANGKNIILLAGGDGKGADFSPLNAVAKSSVKTLIAFGVDGPKIINALGDDCDTVLADSLESAVQQAHQRQSQGDIVLLSPACASFDMFSGYEARGECFQTCVEALCA